jgi:hypothetical protein
MIARFWGKTVVPNTMRQTDAIAFDFFLPRPWWFLFTGRECFLGEGSLVFTLQGDFKEYLSWDSVPSPAKGNYSPWNPMLVC